MGQRASRKIPAPVYLLLLGAGLPLLYLLGVPPLIRLTATVSPHGPAPSRLDASPWITRYCTAYDVMASQALLEEPLGRYSKWWGTAISPSHITIYGQVVHQGRYTLMPGTSLRASQAILRAGGFTSIAQDRKVKVVRKVKGKDNVIIFVNLRQVFARGDLTFDIPIRPGDVVIVDEKLYSF